MNKESGEGRGGDFPLAVLFVYSLFRSRFRARLALEVGERGYARYSVTRMYVQGTIAKTM